MLPIAKASLVIAAAMGLAVMTAAPAEALVRVSGSGAWQAGQTATDASGAGQAWSFSFLLTDAFSNPTNRAAQFVYSLGGAPLDMTLDTVEFQPDFLGGLFSFDFTLNGAQGRFQLNAPVGPNEPLIGPDVGSDGHLVLGSFAAQIIDVRIGGAFPSGLGTVTLESAGPDPVPEPAAWALMLAGFGLTGAALRRRSRLALA